MLLDEDALRDLGHDDREVKWLLSYASRGPKGRPFLTRDEYERLSCDLPQKLDEDGVEIGSPEFVEDDGEGDE
jgi:hypothetical protein